MMVYIFLFNNHISLNTKLLIITKVWLSQIQSGLQKMLWIGILSLYTVSSAMQEQPWPTRKL